MFAEHRVQTEGVAARRCWSCSDGWGCSLPFSQSHLSSVCRQHPCTVSRGGKHFETLFFPFFFLNHKCRRVIDSCKKKKLKKNHLVIINGQLTVYAYIMLQLCEMFLPLTSNMIDILASSQSLAWLNAGGMWRTSWMPVRRWESHR